MRTPSLAGTLLGRLAGKARRVPIVESVYLRVRRLNLLVVSLGTKCSLRCRDCGNFIPQSEQVLYDWESVVADTRCVVEAVRGVRSIQIQGGEPFLHPNLPDVLAAVRALQVDEIVVATNGMHVLSEPVVGAFKSTGAVIRISNYSVVERAATRIDRLVAQLSEAGIVSEVYRFASGKDHWLGLGPYETPREEDDRIVARRFETCPFQRCYTLERGLLGRCSRSTLACHLGQTDFDADSYVAVERLRTKSRRDAQRRILHYVTRHRFMNACRRCLGGDAPSVEPGVQLTGPVVGRLRFRPLHHR